jgi:hypothetical protein
LSDVAAEIQAMDPGIGCGGAHLLPGVVPAAIVHQDNLEGVRI